MTRFGWCLLLSVTLLGVACGGDEEPADNTGNNAANNAANNAGNNAGNNTGNNDANNSSFVPEPYVCEGIPNNGYMAASGDMCDLLAQDCPNDEGCYLTNGAGECFPPTEERRACGEDCTAGNQCAPGQICAGSPMRCVALCQLGEGCPGASTCDPLQGRDDLGVCVPPEGGQRCDILAQDCPGGLSCYLVNGSQVCARTQPEAAGVGARCEEANGCQPGLICVGASEGELRCLRACDPANTTACSGDFCTGIEGSPGLGVCF